MQRLRRMWRKVMDAITAASHDLFLVESTP
jgi:hypothetical protein